MVVYREASRYGAGARCLQSQQFSTTLRREEAAEVGSIGRQTLRTG